MRRSRPGRPACLRFLLLASALLAAGATARAAEPTQARAVDPTPVPAAPSAPSLGGPGRSQTAGTLRRRPRARRDGARRARASLPVVGVLADAGVPDGAIVALSIRPTPWARFHAGAGTNTISAGVRTGVTLSLPAALTPALSLELGHYPAGEANDLVRRLIGVGDTLGPLFQRLGYTYANAHLGLELGSRSFTAFVHGGVTYARAYLQSAGAVLEERASRGAEPGSRTSVTVNRDPIVRVISPSVKVGVVVYLP